MKSLRLGTLVFRVLLIVTLVAILAGCGPLFVKGQVSSFGIWPATPDGTPYALMPMQGDPSDLEFQSYARRINNYLQMYGLRLVTPDQARVIVYVGYGIDDGKHVTTNYPIIGQTGVSGSTTYGTLNSYGGMATYSGTTTYTPAYGVVGVGSISNTVYRRYLQFDVVDKDSLLRGQPNRLYQARLVSEGTIGNLTQVMPSLIKAIFKNFPEADGTTRNVLVTIER
jgi:hypothetical protein